MKRNRLWLNLAVAFALVALLAVGISSFVVNYSFQRRFESYVQLRQEVTAQRLGRSLVSIYQVGGWTEQITGFLPHWAAMNGLKIKVVDVEGRVIADSTSRPADGLTGGGASGQGGPDAQDSPGSTTVALALNGMRIGTLYVAGLDGVGDVPRQDLEFRRGINILMIMGGVLAVLVAVIAGYVISVRLTAPLKAMTLAAKRMEQGSLTQRVPILSEDEIGELGEALNHLAFALESQENLRKRLTADVAHELRTPLASIRSHIEAFQDGVIEPSPGNIESIHEEIIRLGSLVDDLGQLAQVEADKAALSLAPGSLFAVVEKVVGNFQPLFSEKGVELSLTPAAALPEAMIDADKMAQVFYNLLSNALKNTDRGGQVGVSVASSAAGGVRAQVRDTGIGIGEADLPHVFERFYRADKSRSRATGGAGIGLTVVKELVEAHGGIVTATSTPGNGSVFAVELPPASS